MTPEQAQEQLIGPLGTFFAKEWLVTIPFLIGLVIVTVVVTLLWMKYVAPQKWAIEFVDDQNFPMFIQWILVTAVVFFLGQWIVGLVPNLFMLLAVVLHENQDAWLVVALVLALALIVAFNRIRAIRAKRATGRISVAPKASSHAPAVPAADLDDKVE